MAPTKIRKSRVRLTIDVARAMVERISGAQLEEIAGTGHCPPLEKPEEFTTKLVDFLKRKQYID